MGRRKYLGDTYKDYVKTFSQKEYNMAYRVLNELIEQKIISVDYMQMFCLKLRALFE